MHDHPRVWLVAVPGSHEPLLVFRCPRPLCKSHYEVNQAELSAEQRAAWARGEDVYLTR